MSDEKRHTRTWVREQRERWIAKRQNLIRRLPWMKAREAQPAGMFAKRDPFDCGKTQCLCCHGEKLLGLKRASERRWDEVMRDD